MAPKPRNTIEGGNQQKRLVFFGGPQIKKRAAHNDHDVMAIVC
jgi:hypothetical protein